VLRPCTTSNEGGSVVGIERRMKGHFRLAECPTNFSLSCVRISNRLSLAMRGTGAPDKLKFVGHWEILNR
jgi:hypothetical protein